MIGNVSWPSRLNPHFLFAIILIIASNALAQKSSITYVLPPDSGRVIQRIFDLPAPCNPTGISIQKDRAIVTYDRGWRVRLIPPGQKCATNELFMGFPLFGLCVPDTFALECQQGLWYTGFENSPLMQWKTYIADGILKGREAQKLPTVDKDLTSFHMHVAVGMVVLIVFLLGVVMGIRRLMRSDSRAIVTILLLVELIGGMFLVFHTPIHDGDELINMERALLSVFTFGDLDMYVHPPLYFNVIAGLQALYTWMVSWFTGTPVLDAIASTFITGWHGLLIIARVVSLLAGTGISVMTFLSARTLLPRLESAIAALTVFLLSIFFCTDLSPYTTSVFFATLYLYIAVFSEQPLTNRRAFIAGLAGGLSLSSVYLGAIILPLGLLGPWTKKQAWSWKYAAWAVSGVILAVLVTNPHLFDNLSGYARAFSYRVSEFSAYDRRGLAVPANRLAERASPWYYIALLFNHPWRVLGVSGFIAAIIKIYSSKDRRYVFILIAFTWILVVLSLPPTRTNRYLMYLWPIFSIILFMWIPFVRHLKVRTMMKAAIFIFMTYIYLNSSKPTLKTSLLFNPSLPMQRPLLAAKHIIQKNSNKNEPIGIKTKEIEIFRLAYEQGLISIGLVDKFKKVAEKIFNRRLIYVAFNQIHAKVITRQPLPALSVDISYSGNNTVCPHTAGCMIINGFMIRWNRQQP